MPYFTLLLVVCTSTLAVWLPFVISHHFQAIYSHFDGPLYIIPAKTGYDPGLIAKILRDPSMPQNPLYYAAHLPLYPFFIWVGAIAHLGYLKSMLAVTVVSTIVLGWIFYFVLKRFNLTQHPLLLTSIFLLLPRLWVVRSVGSPEPLFILLILASLFFFEKKNYMLAGLMGGLATMTKTPGILLFPAYALVILESYVAPAKEKVLSYRVTLSSLFLLFIPLGLVAVFGIYAVRYHDFFAYFHTGGVVPMPYPFAVFNASAKWVGTAWLEDVLFYFALYAATAVVLWNSKYRSLFYFALTFFVATLFVQHRDISRYSLPLLPLAMIAFEKKMTSKQGIIVFLILLAGIYLYAVNFLGANVMPITEWSPFL